MENLIIFGIQGSGKGTQGVRIAKKNGMSLFETGGALRKIASKNTPLGKKVKNIIDQGNLVTNEIVMEVIEDYVKQIPRNQKIIFDGIPRSLKQKQTFDSILSEYNRKAIALLIEISEKEARKRLLGRQVCSNCKKVFSAEYRESFCDICEGKLEKRHDDNEKAILKRIENYYHETLPAIEEYKNENNLITINGEQSIGNVEKTIEKALTNID